MRSSSLHFSALVVLDPEIPAEDTTTAEKSSVAGMNPRETSMNPPKMQPSPVKITHGDADSIPAPFSAELDDFAETSVPETPLAVVNGGRPSFQEFFRPYFDYTLHLSTWGLRTRHSYTALFSTTRRKSLREAAKVKAYLDNMHGIGLGSHLTNVLDNVQLPKTFSQVCKLPPESVFVFTRFRLGQEIPTHGISTSLGQLSFLTQWRRLNRLRLDLWMRSRACLQLFYSSYLHQQFSLFAWILEGVVSELQLTTGWKAGARLLRCLDEFACCRLVCSWCRRLAALRTVDP
jgi:hypothetical protein